MPRTPYFLLLAILQVPMLYGNAQTNAVVKGTVIHPVNDFVVVSVDGDGLLQNRPDSTLVSDSGYFKQPIAVGKGNYVTITYANQDLRFPVLPGDTVDLALDELLLTYNLSATNPQRKKEINAVLDNIALFDGRLDEINAAVEKGSDSLLNVIYNQQLKDFLQRIPQPAPYLKQTILEIYYRHLTYWLQANPICVLKLNEKILGKELLTKFAGLLPSDQEYITSNLLLFQNSDIYRTFLISYRNTDPALAKAISQDSSINYDKQFHKIIDEVQIPKIRDWLMMNYLKEIYRSGSYADALRLSDEYKPICQFGAIEERIKRMDAEFARIKNGNPAPDFTLEDISGNKVSLSDFKGKWVYLDFWSVNCGTCIGNFIKYSQIINEKYKDKNVVFLNICFEEDANKWRKKVDELQIGGINVIAKGWVNQPVSKDYVADMLPRTFLIDKAGNINNNQLPLGAVARYDAAVINEWLQ